MRTSQAELADLEKNFQKEYSERISKLQKAKTKEEFDSVMLDLDSFISRHKDNSELKQLLDKLLDLSRLCNSMTQEEYNEYRKRIA